MFEHFTFGAASQGHQHHDIHPSPTDTSFPASISPSSSCSYFDPGQEGISDIVNKFNEQSLSRDVLVHRFATWADTPYEIDEDEGMSCRSTAYSSPSSVPNITIDAQGGGIASRRLQRQLNMQLQTSTSHIRDINKLVSDMIVSNSQCRLHKSTSRPHLSTPPPSRSGNSGLVVDTTESSEGSEMSPDPDIDEGFHEDESAWNLELEEMSLRRASTPSGIRKHCPIRWGRSADILCVGGRMKVNSQPRMRKRKVKSLVD